MNPADIWTTLRLPTLVKAKSPAFSLEKAKNSSYNDLGIIYIPTVKMIPPAHVSWNKNLTRKLMIHSRFQRSQITKFLPPNSWEVATSDDGEIIRKKPQEKSRANRKPTRHDQDTCWQSFLKQFL